MRTSSSYTNATQVSNSEAMYQIAKSERNERREAAFDHHRNEFTMVNATNVFKQEPSTEKLPINSIEALSELLKKHKEQDFTIYNRFGNDFSDLNIETINKAALNKNVICFYDNHISHKNNLTSKLSENVIKISYDSLRDHFKQHANNETSPIKEEAKIIIDQIDLNAKYSKLQLSGKAVDHAIMSDFLILSTLCKATDSLNKNIYTTHEHSTKTYSQTLLDKAKLTSNNANDLLIPECNVFAAGNITEQLHLKLIDYVNNINDTLTPEIERAKIGPLKLQNQRQRDLIDNYFRNTPPENRQKYGHLQQAMKSIMVTTKTAPFPENPSLRNPLNPLKDYYTYINKEIRTTWANKATFTSKDQLCDSIAASLMYKGKLETLKYINEAKTLDPTINTEADLLQSALDKLPAGWTPTIGKALIVKTADQDVIDLLSKSVFKDTKLDIEYALRSLSKAFPKYLNDNHQPQYKRKSDYKNSLNAEYLATLAQNQSERNHQLGVPEETLRKDWHDFAAQLKVHSTNVQLRNKWISFSSKRLDEMNNIVSQSTKEKLKPWMNKFINDAGVLDTELIKTRGGPMAEFIKEYENAQLRNDESKKNKLLNEDKIGDDTWYAKNYASVALDFYRFLRSQDTTPAINPKN